MHSASRLDWRALSRPPPRAPGPCDVVPVELTQLEIDAADTDELEDELPRWLTSNRRVLAWRLVCAQRHFSAAIDRATLGDNLRRRPKGGLHGAI